MTERERERERERKYREREEREKRERIVPNTILNVKFRNLHRTYRL